MAPQAKQPLKSLSTRGINGSRGVAGTADIAAERQNFLHTPACLSDLCKYTLGFHGIVRWGILDNLIRLRPVFAREIPPRGPFVAVVSRSGSGDLRDKVSVETQAASGTSKNDSRDG